MSNRQTICFVTSVAIVAIATNCGADSWDAYRSRVVADSKGRFYVVIERDFHIADWDDPGQSGQVRFQFAERKPGTRPVQGILERLPIDDPTDEPESIEQGPVAADGDDPFAQPGQVEKKVSQAPDKIKVREGDIVHGRGLLMRPPLLVLVPSTGSGFVAVDIHGFNSTNGHAPNALIIVSKTGVVQHRKALVDLLPEKDIPRFSRSTNTINWIRGIWIDEVKNTIVVVANRFTSVEESYRHGKKDYAFREISMQDGQPTKATDAVVIHALKHRHHGSLEIALELARELKLQVPNKVLSSICEQTTLPMAARLRAATALHALGDSDWAKLLPTTAEDEHANKRDVEYAVSNLAYVYGDKSLPVLRRLGRRNNSYYLAQEFGKIGATAIPRC